MRYFGGKARIAQKIAKFLKSVRKTNQVYVEPFIGSANVFCLMENERIGSDNHVDLIMLLQEVQSETFVYPESLTEQKYYDLKKSHSCAMRAFAGFGCSYAGKWFGGYARDGGRNFCKNATSTLKKKSKLLQGAKLNHCDYKEVQNLPDNSLIYCDPPYADHTLIHNKKFDSEYFWNVVREWSKKHNVFVSEYSAPSDFVSVLDIPTRTDINGTDGQYKRIEKLFVYNNA